MSAGILPTQTITRSIPLIERSALVPTNPMRKYGMLYAAQRTAFSRFYAGMLVMRFSATGICA